MSLTLEYFYQKTNQNYNLNLLTDSVSLNKKITWVYLLDDVNNPNDGKKIIEFRNKYQKILIMQSNILAVEACSRETSKGIALKWLCDKLKISMDAVVTIGDCESDISMLEYAGISVAMGNAMEEVKKHAKIVIDNNNNDGVGKFLTDILTEIR